jgi:hypothetical protein
MRTIRPGSLETALIFPHLIRYNSDILGIPGFEHDDGAVELFCDDPTQRIYLPAPALEIIRDIKIRRELT